MAKDDMKKVLDGVDVEGIIKKSLKNDIEGTKQGLEESYVATPKTYSQVSEFVSQRTKDLHTKLYNDYVTTLNRVSAELDTAPRGEEANSRHSEFRSLKYDETFNMNAVALHEAFFAGFFDVHSEIFLDSLAYIELEKAWGSFDDWQQDFLACAMSCGNGWAVCGWNTYLKNYINTIVSNNSQDVMVGLIPVIVLDMVEHSYVRDYAGDRRSYSIAMMKQINWNVVEDRVKKIKAIAEVLK